ncbi:MAG: Asparagine synthetase [glutamine-hydrolyzing] 1 [Alphaproteobacteria bacterium MarineAlpha5_Bin9]|nr:MAG: Asparagine synthetase [glutamine-hydrolyzing] 1 [Alphaproteobacteria bacterium MarineAlpha5_Bin9]|tara:strand:- start:30543 stop:32450 length:1908 start_codon:yes stop_codon:yes gene_type:complete
MCGINGIIYKNSDPNLSEIFQMNKSIKHRGPDDEGFLNFKKTLLGHVRLSVLDLSKKGKQPMSNDGRFWIIFNGEIYNFIELKKILMDLGHKFFSNTDTEVILNAYKEWKDEAFKKFNGMWSLAILDKKLNKLIISRDRYGVKPCYYMNKNDKFIFSSEIKGIFASNSDIELDKNKIFLSSKIIEGSFTTKFKNINIIPPGILFEINLNNFKIKQNRWWKSLENIPDININFNKSKIELQNSLFDATNLRMISDVKIATSLSGGIDSSIIFSILNKLKIKNNNNQIDLNPFILNYKGNRTFDDAIELSQHYKKEPILINYQDRDINKISSKLSAIEITDPYFSQLELYKKQKDLGFKVSIDGHGADECLGGYLKDIEQFGLFYQNQIVDLYQTIINNFGKEGLNHSVERLGLVSKINGFKIDLNNLFRNNKVGNDYVDSEIIELNSEYLQEDLNELDNFNFPFQIMYLNSTYGHMQWLLNKWDKASMNSSIEIRSPYLDWRFFQYCLALPTEFKIKFGKTKFILREAFKKYLTKSINRGKSKQGLPLKNFEINEINLKFIQEIINQNDFKINSLWDGKKILNDFNNNEKRINKIQQIWSIIQHHLLIAGFEKRKKDSNNINLKNIDMKNNFNFLS